MIIIIILAAIADIFWHASPFWQKYFGHPIIWIGKLIALCDKNCNKPQNTPIISVALGGISMAFITILGAITITIIDFFPPIAHGILSFLLIYILLSMGSLIQHVRAIALALNADDLNLARQELQKIVSRDAKKLDANGVARSALESLGENFCDAVIAPIFWLLFGGIQGLVIFKIISTHDSMIGYHNEKYEYYGKISAICDDIMNYIPARITALLFMIFAPINKQKPREVWRIMRRDAKNHLSPNAGLTESAFAGALGLKLGGARYYDGVLKENTYGDGKFACDGHDILLAIRFCLIIYAIFLLILGVIYGMSVL